MPIKKKKPVRKSVKRNASKRRVAKKSPPKKRPVRAKKAAVKKPRQEGNVVGIVTHYFSQVRAAVIKLKAPLATGDTIKIKGHTTDFTQSISSMQIDRAPITEAKKGQEIGVLVDSRVRQHDVVYKL